MGMPSRRSVLKLGLLGSLGLAVGGVGLGLRSGLLRTPAGVLRCLDLRRFSTLAAAAEVLSPGGNGLPTAEQVHVAERVDEAFSLCHPGVQREMRQLLALLESALTGALIDRRITPFSACDLATRKRVLGSWQASRNPLLAAGFHALHAFCAGAFYSAPEVMGRIGYPGPQPWLLEARRELGSGAHTLAGAAP